mgnify:CR=1 FL=1
MEKKRAFTAKPAEKALCTAYRLLQFSKGLSQFLHIPFSDNRQKPPELFLRQILAILDDEQPDGVLIAGDVYDKSVPSVEAVELLDLGLERMPTWQIRFTDTNTYPFLEAYYAASAMGVEEAAAKGDALLREYAQTLIEYIEYYLRFEGTQGDMVSPILDEKLDQLGDVYYLAVYAGRKEIIGEINAYYRSLGVEEENLVDVGDKPHQVDTTLIPRKDTAQ